MNSDKVRAVNGDIVIRSAEAGDIPGILEIERECFDSDAWSDDDFCYRLAEDGFITLVAVGDGRLAGYCAVSAFYDINVDSVAVSPDFRRRGIARGLLLAAFEGRSGKVFLEVRASNAPAQALYKSMGFEKISERRNYYDRPLEDAIIMAADIGKITSCAEGRQC